MTIEEFVSSVAESDAPKEGFSLELQALWYDKKGDWERAHELCQEAGSQRGDWVHAYLHRVEGDRFNAKYWYGRCGKPEFDGSLEEEWTSLAREFLG